MSSVYSHGKKMPFDYGKKRFTITVEQEGRLVRKTLEELQDLQQSVDLPFGENTLLDEVEEMMVDLRDIYLASRKR